jgi:hypothetical protein
MHLPMVADLNKLEAWILQQEDCWLPNNLTFHKGLLFEKFCREHNLSFTTFDSTLEKDRLIRVIALAELGAKHKKARMANVG